MQRDNRNTKADIAQIGLRLFALLATATEKKQFAESAMTILSEVEEIKEAALCQLAAGQFSTLAGNSSAKTAFLRELTATTLDEAALTARNSWKGIPLATKRQRGEVLLLKSNQPEEDCLLLASVFATAFDILEQNSQHESRIEQLSALLEIAQQWNRADEMEPLFTQMAETATRLLRCDRASIFLWDRPNKTLVARPALGVENEELLLDDDVGVVGSVVHSGKLIRVDENQRGNLIDHNIDKQLGYQTRNLLCVPLLDGKGNVLGAFEVLNCLQGNFTAQDEQTLSELATHAAVALENTQQREQLISKNRQLVEQAAEGIRLVGESPAIKALRSTIDKVADTELAILILGENGTGKEVASQSIHYLSRRRNEPFVAVNCAALTETLLESELFGHEKGAFTDAHQARAGKFELASGGTLFLDEIGDLSSSGQAKLLRVLEEKTVVRVGGSRPIHTDVRVIAATNQDLSAMVREKKFREDLYYRLNVVSISMPPLRERDEDIVMLAEYFLQKFCLDAGRTVPRITASARRRLLAHNWPGNVRELRNSMERLAYLSSEERIEVEDLSFVITPAENADSLVEGNLPLSEATRTFQVEYIRQAIKRSQNNVSDAAKRLGLHRANLYRKMNQLKMDATEEKTESSD